MPSIPYRVSHSKMLDFKDSVRDLIKTNPAVCAGLSELAKRGLCRTITTRSGKKLGVMGGLPMVPGVCEVFIFATKHQHEYPVEFARVVKSELRRLKKGFRRVQALAPDEADSHRWLTWLGFEREGVLKCYGADGEDLAIWGMV